MISAIFVYSCSKSGTEPENKPATKPVAVTAVSLNKSKLELSVGDKEKLVVTISPGNATNKSVAWSSSNTSVVTVQNGEVTAIKAGSATVTVKSVDGGKSATCEVTVKENSVPVTSISLDESSLELFVDESVALSATIEPENATNKNIEWRSSNESVATVSNGVVTAISEGSATITAITEDGGKEASCQVRVKRKVIPVESVTLDYSELEMIVGDTLRLTATVLPENASNKSVIWNSEDNSVVKFVNEVLYAVGKGSTTVSVTTEDGGKTAVCRVTVTEKIENVPVTGITLNNNSAELYVGETITLSAGVVPSNATNKNIFWKSSNPSVARVENGVVTACGAGNTTITATTEDGGKTATCQVTVNEKIIEITNISLDKNLLQLYKGDVITLKAIITPENATDQTLVWSSSNESVATVADGIVTAKSKGFATIVAKNESSGKYGDCLVEVKDKVISVIDITLDRSSAEVYTGDSFTLVATISPSDATNQNINWKSSNTSVATVSNGIVTARSAGSAIITATTEDGGKSATCSVVVKARVTGITLDRTDVEIYAGESFTLKATVTPSDATNKRVIWSTSNNSLATVNNGVVKALKPGKVTITATAEDGGKSATCNVVIKSKVDIDDWEDDGERNEGEAS